MDSDSLIRKIKNAVKVTPDDSARHIAMACMDLTSLSGEETAANIKSLCDKAKAGSVGAVCVYPHYIKQVQKELDGTGIQIATVINFPHGNKTNDGDIATFNNTYDAVKQANADGATEIDIVVDYNDFTEENARELLRACRQACTEGNLTMKVILEVENGHPAVDLPARAELAIVEGADMIKTSTGKYHEPISDHDKMECTLIMIQEIKKTLRDVGLKISGGVNGENYAQYLALVEHEMGAEFINAKSFRFGASGLYNDLNPSITRRSKSTLAY